MNNMIYISLQTSSVNVQTNNSPCAACMTTNLQDLKLRAKTHTASECGNFP